MDEEAAPRQSQGLHPERLEAHLASSHRLLDRTGDEIHTSMEAGPMIRRTTMKAQPWIKAYEDWNGRRRLPDGLPATPSIGKACGRPRQDGDMLVQKCRIPGRRQPPPGCPRRPRDAACAALSSGQWAEPPGGARQRRPRAKLSDILTIRVSQSNWLPTT